VLERRRQKLRDRIDVNGWLDTLVAIARSKRLTDDAKCLDVLFQRLAFHYNGEVWYDVHPLVTEIPDFESRFSPRLEAALEDAVRLRLPEAAMIMNMLEIDSTKLQDASGAAAVDHKSKRP